MGEDMEAVVPKRLVLFSFGFKYGVPVDVNFIWDVRFLPNPYWVAELRPKTGRQQDVADYVVNSDEGAVFLKLLMPLLLEMTSGRLTRDKTIRIAIGCTGGRHRSVAVCEHLGASLRRQNLSVELFHRDIDRDRQRPA